MTTQYLNRADSSVYAIGLASSGGDVTQVQSPQPIWPQPDEIPAGVHNIELSFDRFARADGAYMRVIFRDLADDPKAMAPHPYHERGQAHPYTWWFKELLGDAQVISTNNADGRINLRGMAVLVGERLILYRDPDALPHPQVDGTRRDATHNRLCYRRAKLDWRLRDERKSQTDPANPDNLAFVTGYVGDLHMEWVSEDVIGHIYHNGYTVIDAAGLAHFYDPAL